MKSILGTLLVAGLICCSAGCVSTSETSTPKAWAEVQAGMTRQELHERLGPPNAAEPYHEVWCTGRWDLDVAYDSGNRVRQAVSIYKPK